MKIVILIDNSPPALAALKAYLNIHHQPNNQVHLYHANVPPSLPSLNCLPTFPTDEIMSIMNKHNQTEQELEITCDNLAKESEKPASQNLKFVKNWEFVESGKDIGLKAVEYVGKVEADLVVCGTRNLSKFEKVFVGSVSEYVLKRVTCPVLIHKI